MLLSLTLYSKTRTKRIYIDKETKQEEGKRKVWIISKKTGVLYALILVLLISLVYIGKNEAISVSSTKRDLPIYCVDKPEDDKTIAISFDAAWAA